MYAIRNKKTKQWIYGTDYHYNPPHQRTSFDRAVTYESLEYALLDFKLRKCTDNYKITPVQLQECDS